MMYKYIVNDDTKTKLFSWKYIICFSFGFIILLSLLFPKSSLIETLRNSNDNELLAKEYLESITAIYPDFIDMQLELLEYYAQLNDTVSFKQHLSHIQNYTLDSNQKQKLSYIQYQLQKQLYFNSGTSISSTSKATLQQNILELARTSKLNNNDLISLANDAYLLDDKELAKHILTKLSSYKSLGNSSLFVLAKLYHAIGEYQSSADLYMQLMYHQQLIKDKIDLFVKALKILEEGNLTLIAITYAQKHAYPALLNDKETLIYLAKLSHRANNPKLAAYYVSKALKLP